MQPYAGMFYSKNPKALSGVCDAPYLMLGRHALCGEGYAFDGGAAALAIGRIRNGARLIARFKERGLPFESDGDCSSLLLSAYRLWGVDCVREIEGPVNLVVIDQDAGRLLLARDRMGENPLFYARCGAQVAFAGHPSALLRAPGARRAVDADGLRELFALGPARTPGRTPFRDLYSLRPGHMLVTESGGMRVSRYWGLEAAEHEDDYERTVETVRGLIERAVADISGLRPAVMLSGGLDSSVLAAFLRAARGDKIDAYSLDYEDNERYFSGGEWQTSRDAPYADMAATCLDLRHERVIAPIAALSGALGEAMEARGFPGMADVDSSLLLFARRMAARGAKYVLSGECADEVFGGYPWFQRPELYDADGFPWSGSLALRERVLKKSVAAELKLSAYADARYREALSEQPLLPGERGAPARLRALQGLCFDFFMANLQERASAIVSRGGATALTPYCDERLAQYVYNVPWEMKNAGGRAKGLLRDAARGLLPEELLERRKTPFPKTHHPEYARIVCQRLRSILADRRAPLNALVDAEALDEIMRGDLSPSATPWFGQLMGGAQLAAYLIQVNCWLESNAVEIEL